MLYTPVGSPKRGSSRLMEGVGSTATPLESSLSAGGIHNNATSKRPWRVAIAQIAGGLPDP